jgi:hypothetical protein
MRSSLGPFTRDPPAAETRKGCDVRRAPRLPIHPGATYSSTTARLANCGTVRLRPIGRKLREDITRIGAVREADEGAVPRLAVSSVAETRGADYV